MAVWFIDTSILCNIIPVPGRSQDRPAVISRLTDLQKAGHSFVLPLTTVIETGNHISHLNDGRERRITAKIFTDLLRLVINNQTPWRLHAFSWDENFLGSLVEGASTGISLVEHATAGVGCGDLCVLVERDIYRARTGLQDVQVWTLDNPLAAHS